MDNVVHLVKIDKTIEDSLADFPKDVFGY